MIALGFQILGIYARSQADNFEFVGIFVDYLDGLGAN
jgi:hypothetical protein